MRDKDVQIEFALKDIKKLELAELNQSFLEDLGFENEQELRDGPSRADGREDRRGRADGDAHAGERFPSAERAVGAAHPSFRIGRPSG